MSYVFKVKLLILITERLINSFYNLCLVLQLLYSFHDENIAFLYLNE